MKRSIVAVLTLVLLLWGAMLLACLPAQTVSAHSIAGSADIIGNHSEPDVSSPLADVGPVSVTIAGPTMGVVEVGHAFIATVSPVSTTVVVGYNRSHGTNNPHGVADRRLRRPAASRWFFRTVRVAPRAEAIDGRSKG